MYERYTSCCAVWCMQPPLTVLANTQSHIQALTHIRTNVRTYTYTFTSYAYMHQHQQYHQPAQTAEQTPTPLQCPNEIHIKSSFNVFALLFLQTTYSRPPIHHTRLDSPTIPYPMNANIFVSVFLSLETFPDFLKRNGANLERKK